MRKWLIGALTVLAVLLCAPAAAEAAPPDQTPVEIPSTIPVNRCGFLIDVGVIRNNETQTVSVHDGVTITKVKGDLVLSFTNHDTGKSIVRNVSGPTTATLYPDGTRLFEGTGNNYLTFGPISQSLIPEPGLVFTSGKVTVKYDNGTSRPSPRNVPAAYEFSLNGHQVNGCDLLE
jgi:hypothetical protein